MKRSYLIVSLLASTAFFVGCDHNKPSCKGTPEPCESLSQLPCEDAAGCHYDGDCSGPAVDCSTHHDSLSCFEQPNCTWNSSLGSCDTTFTVECSMYMTAEVCSTYGCSFTPACIGTPYDCSLETSETTCAMQAGCSWR